MRKRKGKSAERRGKNQAVPNMGRRRIGKQIVFSPGINYFFIAVNCKQNGFAKSKFKSWLNVKKKKKKIFVPKSEPSGHTRIAKSND